MNTEKADVFEVKKKEYRAPEIKTYGSFSSRTKGTGFGNGRPDGATYYGQDLTS